MKSKFKEGDSAFYLPNHANIFSIEKIRVDSIKGDNIRHFTTNYSIRDLKLLTTEELLKKVEKWAKAKKY